MFGRKNVADEDPFAALKQGGTYQSTPTTMVAGIPGSGLADEPTIVPSVAPLPVAPLPVAPSAPPTGGPTAPPPPPIGASRQSTTRSMRGLRMTPYGMRRRSGGGQIIVWVVVLGLIAAIIVPIISTASHAVHSFRVPSFHVPTPSFSTPATPTPTRRPHATDYLAPAAVRTGFRRILERFPGARVTNLRLDGSSMDAFIYPRHGDVKDLTMNPSGTFVSTGSGTGEAPIAISAIPAGAISRIVSGLKQRFQVRRSRIDYIVLTTIPHLPPRWIAFSRAPSHAAYAANLDGSGLQKLGG